MEKIMAVNTFGSTDIVLFQKELQTAIQNMQGLGMDVEVTYSSTHVCDHVIYHGAMLIGRRQY